MRTLQLASGSGHDKTGLLSLHGSLLRVLCSYFLYALIYPLAVILFLLLGFPLLCSHFESCVNYYTFTAVSLVSFVPWINWLLIMTVKDKKNSENTPDSYLPALTAGILLNIFLISPVVFISHAVASQGWLRTVYIIVHYSISGSLIFNLFHGLFSMIGKRGIHPAVSVLLPVSVPLGLVLHHPFNYLFFLSPLYWISWSWIITPAPESFIYGVIGAALALVYGLAGLRFSGKTIGSL